MIYAITKMKKIVSFLLTITMLLTFAIVAVPMKKAEAETPLVLTMPENDGKTNKTSYKIGQGTEDEVTVTANFIPESHHHRPKPGQTMTMEYIVIHNTGNFNSTAGSKAHNSLLVNNSNLSCSYAYVVGTEGIWQNLPDLEYSWHTGTNSFGTNVYHPNAIGIETCDNGAPTKSDGLPNWNSQALYNWYENSFAQRVGYLAMLVATLCMRYDFNPYTQIVQHYDVFGKECPMEMRYVFGTTSNVGSKTNGTYYKIFWDKMIKYYEAYGGKYRGYVTGKYVLTLSSTPIYSNAARSGSSIGSIPQKAAVTVTEVSGSSGKVSYNGVTGWIYLQSGVCQNVVGANKVKYVKPVSNFQFSDPSIVAKDGIIYGVKENVTANALNAGCTNSLKVLDKNGNQVTSGLVATGHKVQSLSSNGGVVEECILIIKGDVDGDGKVTNSDYIAIKAAFKLGKSNFDTYQALAAEVSGKKRLTISDYLAIKRHVQSSYNLFK